ncbi:hypothetical protein LCGC14_2408800, partial [marine sediment metagenome]
SHKELSEKLKEFAENAKSEAENLTKSISDFGGEVETSERHTDQNAISWVSRPLPNADDVDEVVEFLIKGEKRREEELNEKFSGKDTEREVKNLFMKYKEQNESNLVYLQSVKDSLEKAN